MRWWAEQLDTEPTFYVGIGETPDYQYAGAQKVIEGGGLVASRNMALEDAQSSGAFCLQLDDDLVHTHWARDGKREPTTLAAIVAAMEAAMAEHEALLGGVAPTANAFYASDGVSTDKFIIGSCMLVDPASTIRFDTTLRLKEDYDYTLQHLDTYGRVARLDDALVEFQHYSNRGGAVTYRDEEMEQAAIRFLKERWPDAIRDNPRRPNEVLLRWRPA